MPSQCGWKTVQQMCTWHLWIWAERMQAYVRCRALGWAADGRALATKTHQNPFMLSLQLVSATYEAHTTHSVMRRQASATASLVCMDGSVTAACLDSGASPAASPATATATPMTAAPTLGSACTAGTTRLAPTARGTCGLTAVTASNAFAVKCRICGGK